MARPEFDLAGLQMALQRRQPEGIRGGLDDPYRAVPRSGHADDVLVADGHPAPFALHLLEGGELGRSEGVGIGADLMDQVGSREVAVPNRGSVAPVEERPRPALRPLNLGLIDGGGE